MATQDVWQANSCNILEPPRDDDFWLDNAYTFEPLSWNSSVDDTGFSPRTWTETDFEELQRTDSVPIALLRPDVAVPEFAHPSSVDGYARQGGFVTSLQTPYSAIGKIKHERGKASSIVSDRDSRQADEPQHLGCSECGLEFENLQGLDKHSRSSLHKAWRCNEPGCGKTYARRDTFLRHRTKHTDSAHPCNVCFRSNKHKVFKRKDHLKEHMRNCHSHSVDGTRLVRSHEHCSDWTDVRSAGQRPISLVSISWWTISPPIV
jgi:hypothetical protein